MKARDNRRFYRGCVDFPITVETDCCGGDLWVARALNVSVGGILLWSAQSMRLNVPLIIHFPPEWVRAFAVIKAVWKDGYYYGCEFIDPAPSVVSALSRTAEHYRHCQAESALDSQWQQL